MSKKTMRVYKRPRNCLREWTRDNITSVLARKVYLNQQFPSGTWYVKKRLSNTNHKVQICKLTRLDWESLRSRMALATSIHFIMLNSLTKKKSSKVRNLDHFRWIIAPSKATCPQKISSGLSDASSNLGIRTSGARLSTPSASTARRCLVAKVCRQWSQRSLSPIEHPWIACLKIIYD